MHRTAEINPRQENTLQLFKALAEKNQDEIKRLAPLDINWTQTIKSTSGGTNPTLLNRASSLQLWEAVEIFNKIIAETAVIKEHTTSDPFQFGAAILNAAKYNQIEILKQLFNSSKKILLCPIDSNWHYLDKKGDLALHAAIRNNYAEVIRLLLDYGYSLEEKNAESLTPAELAIQLSSLECLSVISEKTPIDPLNFEKNSTVILLNMMLKGVKLISPGYDHKKLQAKRLDILNTILKLPTPEKITTLAVAKDRSTLLGSYLLCHSLGPWDAIFNAELSAEAFEKCIDTELTRHYQLASRSTSSTTTLLSKSLEMDFDLDDTSLEDIELNDARIKHNSDSDATSESESLEDKPLFTEQNRSSIQF